LRKGPLNPDINSLYASHETIPSHYWDRLKEVYVEEIIKFNFLSHPAFLDLNKKKIKINWQIDHTYQLYLVILYYLYQRRITLPPEGVIWVLPNELRGGMHFFKDSHPINTDYVIKCFRERFTIERIMREIGGKQINLGDFGFVVPVFDGILLRYIFWEGDEDLSDSLSINVQKDLEDFFPLDVIWAMINVVNKIISYLSKI
jgi:hypothetical protein